MNRLLFTTLCAMLLPSMILGGETHDDQCLDRLMNDFNICISKENECPFQNHLGTWLDQFVNIYWSNCTHGVTGRGEEKLRNAGFSEELIERLKKRPRSLHN